MHWSSGATELTFTSSTRCTLVVQADPAEQKLPAEWRLLWVADSCDIRPIPLAEPASCGQDMAEVTSVTGPSNLSEIAANLVTARLCSTGENPAATARFVLDLPAASRGRLKVVALDPTDPESSRVVQSSIVTFNGGAAYAFPSVVLRATSVHRSTEFRLDVVGAGLAETGALTLVASDGSWRLPLSVTSQGDTAVTASAAIAAHVPACTIEAQAEKGGTATTTLAADPPPPPLEPQSGCQENFVEDVYPPDETSIPPDPIQPKDFAFVPGGWTPVGTWNFHLFYIRQNQWTKLYEEQHGGIDFTEKNFGHAVSNDLHDWTVLDTAVVEVGPSGSFDSKHVWAPSIVQKGLTYYMFYAGVDDNGEQRIGLTTSTDLVNWTPGAAILSVADLPNWVDRTPPGYNFKAQLRDPFVREDPDAPGDWLMYFVTVASDYTPGMVVGLARSDGDFTNWQNSAPLWATLHPWPSAVSHRVESGHVFPRDGNWWLFYTANGDTVYGVSNPNGPADTVTANWTQGLKLRALVPPDEATTYNFWHATEYLEIETVQGPRSFLAAFNDANESISYTQMGDAPPYLFTGVCPSATAVGEIAASIETPRLLLTGLRPARSRVGLRVELPARAQVQLSVFDVIGRRVATLVDGELPTGSTELSWDGRDANGASVGNSVYFASLVTGGNRRSVRVPLIR